MYCSDSNGIRKCQFLLSSEYVRGFLKKQGKNSYFEDEVDDDHDCGAVVNAFFPFRQFQIHFRVPRLPANKNQPENVDDQGQNEQHDHNQFLVLGS